MGFQRKPITEIKRRITVELPNSLYRFLEERARHETDGSKNAVVVQMIAAHAKLQTKSGPTQAT